MDFLKALLGEELYKQIESKINEHNGNEANKDKLIKLANIASGDYVGKGKHDALQETLNGKTAELEKANGLIEELKKSTKGNEELQGKISGYETQVGELQAQLAETKVKAALKVALLSEKATDIDYLTYKLEEKLKADGKSLELDGNENIKGIDDLLTGLKTQFPTQFEKAGASSEVDVFKLDEGKKTATLTKEEFNKMGYNSRVKLKSENPDLYNSMMKG